MEDNHLRENPNVSLDTSDNLNKSKEIGEIENIETIKESENPNILDDIYKLEESQKNIKVLSKDKSHENKINDTKLDNNDIYSKNNTVWENKKLNNLISILLTFLNIVSIVIFSYVIYNESSIFKAVSIFIIFLLTIILIVINSNIYSKNFNEDIIYVNIFRIISLIFCMVLFIYSFHMHNSTNITPNETIATVVKDNKYNTSKSVSFIKYKTSNFTELEDYNIRNHKTLKIGYVEDIDDENIIYATSSIPKTTFYQITKYKDFSPMIEDLYANKLDLIIVNEIYRNAIKNIKTNFDTETEVVCQVQEINNKIDYLSNLKSITQTTNIAFIGSFDSDNNINVDAENNIVLLMTICPETNEILLANIPIDTIGKIGNTARAELLKYTGVYGSNGFVESIIEITHTDFTKYVKFNMNTIETLMSYLEIIDVKLSDAVKTDDFNFAKGNNEMNYEQIISLLTSEENNEKAFEYQKAVMIGIIKKITSNRFMLNSMEALSTTLGKTERTIEDDFWYSLLQFQYINNPDWKIIEYNIQSESSDRIYSKTARKMVNTSVISEENLDDYLMKVAQMMSKDSIIN